MGQVFFDLLGLEVREDGEPTRSEDRAMTYRLEVRGILPIPAPADERSKDLARAAGSEPGEEALQHP